MTETYVLDNGIFRPESGVVHREEEYDSSGFARLLAMQERHFWYRGRHRFLRRALECQLARSGTVLNELKLADLGGGCGGWIKYLLGAQQQRPRETALADSSRTALDFAADVLPTDVDRYQIDLLNLEWESRWDLLFLLDVLEHIPQDEAALRQIHTALAPGGLLFVTTPALKYFWSWNDDAVHHVRRYAKADFRRLAEQTGLELVDARYFMFFLSPLLILSRMLNGWRVDRMSDAERNKLLEKSHRVPNAAINAALTAAFGAETPLGHWIGFPWGTSILGVFRKPVPC